MSSRPRLQKKRFSSCGHRGFGQYCHYCADRSMGKQAIVKEAKIDREVWLETYQNDSIDLRHLPKSIVLKARAILAKLAEGIEYYKLHGKRLLGIDRNLIRIPVTRRYRLLLKDCGNNSFQPFTVLSHEAYNAITRRGL